MLAARLLSRVSAAPKAAAALAPWAAANCQGGAAPAWRGILGAYPARSNPHATFAFTGRDDKRQDRPPASPLGHTLAASPLIAAAAGSPSLRAMATGGFPGSPGDTGPLPTDKGPSSGGIPGSNPHPHSTGLDADPVGGSGYAVLAVAHAALAATALVAPAALANVFFPGAALPQGMQTQVLAQILGCGLATGAASSWALKQAADDGALASPSAQRLQLGLMGFSLGAVALHLLYSPSITVTSLLSGAAVMGTTFAIPYQTYSRATGGAPRPGDVAARYFGAVPDHLRVTGVQSALYSVLTPTLALAGASYLFAPGYTLAAAFGYVKGTASFFLWQHAGAALATLAPALTYTLKKQADEGRLGDAMSKTLNAGLLVSALGHVGLLFPMFQAGQGGPLLPWLLGAWAAAAATGGLGLVSGGATAAGTKV